ncbi:hypothetical protein [Georgenia sp. SUBG003]|uniref:hypothetical protein n=1 Tax=Georgenia sp. SUBG003 TaxID=1497974 RepID=UPI003AB2B270
MTEALPGDDVLPSAGLSATRAVDIEAPPGSVWPWIAQLGQGRGGFYSYDVLENLAGCDIYSADKVVPEWQDVAAGDEIRLAPEVALSVADVSPPRHLVLHGGVAPGMPAPRTTSPGRRAPPDVGRRHRLLVRERYGWQRTLALGGPGVGGLHREGALCRSHDQTLVRHEIDDLVRQLRTSEHRSMYSYVRLSIDRCTATYVEHRSMTATYV